ncbi:MAG: HPP family protein [Halodesulfurarchaeum sp.]|nr:HPP family protein [Halodesulfurarchaeum sp.]
MSRGGGDVRGSIERFLLAGKYHVVETLHHRISSTERLLHLMIVFVVPVILAGLTWLSNAIDVLPFVIYPPLAAGTYTLFADPESQYADPKRFVGGMTLGAFSGWAALEFLTAFWYSVPPGYMEVHAGATALAIALTAVLTWALDLEVPTAFSAALLALLAGTNVAYVIAIAVSSAIVAGVFLLWYEHVYEQRAEFLYRTTARDDRVLVPVRGLPTDEETALFGALLAAAHEAGRVVLYRASPHEPLPEPVFGPPTDPKTAPTDAQTEGAAGLQVVGPWSETPDIGLLERVKAAIGETVDVPTEIAVEPGDPENPRTTIEAAHTLACDLIVTSHRGELANPTPYLVGLFGGDVDTIAFHPTDLATSWSRVLVLVRGPGPTAHAMIDFATRIAATPERVSVAHTVEERERRREAETMLTELVDSFESDIETRVATGPVGEFLERNGAYYDVVFIGSSSDRSVTSRIRSPPTFRNLDGIDTDIALVHLG